MCFGGGGARGRGRGFRRALLRWLDLQGAPWPRSCAEPGALRREHRGLAVGSSQNISHGLMVEHTVGLTARVSSGESPAPSRPVCRKTRLEWSPYTRPRSGSQKGDWVPGTNVSLTQVGVTLGQSPPIWVSFSASSRSCRLVAHGAILALGHISFGLQITFKI